jgi:uncharacterized sulfatase
MTTHAFDVAPNLIFVHVDELRFPVEFPEGIETPDAFLAKVMPHLHRLLWRDGIKFTNYQAAANACTGSRASFTTGLYAHQHYCLVTRANPSNAQSGTYPQPPLNPAFPTYGKLLREIGYDTPYIGKWHLSDCPTSSLSSAFYDYLEPFGFQGISMPDPIGFPGNGIGATVADLPPSGATPPLSDADIARQALGWLQNRAQATDARPFCLTVGFVNPHDKQFFWGGTEAHRFNALYKSIGEKPNFDYSYSIVEQADPPSYGYRLPKNWESRERLAASGPSLHVVWRELFEYFTGGFSDDPAAADFSMTPTPVAEGKHTAVAPFSYWTRAMDMYTQAMSAVDVQIGQLVENIPESIARNTVVIFVSDHGEFASAHGLQGKAGSVYRESMHVPLIVRDLTGRYAADPEKDRDQLLSGVDLLPLLVSLGRGGAGWMREEPYRRLYGSRANAFAILANPGAPGRRYALHTVDEVVPITNNYLRAPDHIIGVVSESGKLGTYTNWQRNTSTPEPRGMETEYFDYASEGGRLEIESTPDSPKAQDLLRRLFTDLIPNELQAPLPPQYQAAQQEALQGYWRYVELANAMTLVSAF